MKSWKLGFSVLFTSLLSLSMVESASAKFAAKSSLPKYSSSSTVLADHGYQGWLPISADSEKSSYSHSPLEGYRIAIYLVKQDLRNENVIVEGEVRDVTIHPGSEYFYSIILNSGEIYPVSSFDIREIRVQTSRTSLDEFETSYAQWREINFKHQEAVNELSEQTVAILTQDFGFLHSVEGTVINIQYHHHWKSFNYVLTLRQNDGKIFENLDSQGFVSVRVKPQIESHLTVIR